MNSCRKEEFNCFDGTCVAMEQRCNGKIDCDDKSDELRCDMIFIDRSYLPTIPAPPDTELQAKFGDQSNNKAARNFYMYSLYL